VALITRFGAFVPTETVQSAGPRLAADAKRGYIGRMAAQRGARTARHALAPPATPGPPATAAQPLGAAET